MLGVDLVEDAAIGKMRVLGLLPATKQLVHGEQIDFAKLLGKFGQRHFVAGSIKVAPGNVLAFGAVEVVDVCLGDLARAAAINHFVSQV